MRYVLWASLVFLFAGCASQSPEVTSKLSVLELRPEWKQFALDNYKDVIKKALKAPATARFPDPPIRIAVTYDPSRDQSGLIMTVNVDAENTYGALIRSTFAVAWKAQGNVANQDHTTWEDGNTLELSNRID